MFYMIYYINNRTLVTLILLISSVVSSLGQQPFPVFPPKDVNNTMDRDQMLFQMGIKLPDLPPKAEDKNAPPNSWPADKSKPEGNWTDINKNTITRSPFGLWNNYSDRSAGFFPGPDSARLGNYTPIDLLKMKNGKTIKSPKQWWKKQRPEIMKDLQEQLYGKTPDAAYHLDIKWNISSSEDEIDNKKFIQKEITGEIDISGYPEVRNRPVLSATLRVPANSSSRVPCNDHTSQEQSLTGTIKEGILTLRNGRHFLSLQNKI